MRLVSREYLVELLDQYYQEQQNFCSFCNKKKCVFSQKAIFFEEELRNRRFNTANSDVLIWRISHEKKNKNIVCIRPEF